MSNLKAHLALLIINVIYAVSYGFSKDVFEGYIPPFAFILIRVLGASILFWLLVPFTNNEKLKKEDLPKFILCAFFGVAANQLMFFEGLNNTMSINASVIMVATPLIVLLLSKLILGEALKNQKVLGVLIGLGGALALILSKAASGKISYYGDLMILLNATSYGFYLVLVKPLMQKYHPLTVIRWAFTFGFIMVLPFGLTQWSEINWDFTPTILLEVIFIVVATTFLTYLLTMYSLGKVSPTIVSAYIYIQPVLATLIAVMQGEEELTVNIVVYGLMIFLGVFLVSIPIQKKQNVRESK